VQSQPSPLSPLDGRYAADHMAQAFFSEVHQHRFRWTAELLWLMSLQAVFPDRFAQGDLYRLHQLALNGFEDRRLRALRSWEDKTRHDVKALELTVADTIREAGMGHLVPLLHLGLTSEDVVGMAWGAALNDWWELMSAQVDEFLVLLERLGRKSDGLMMARTHGQPAAPTTMAKELEVFASRLERLSYQDPEPIAVKWGGAVGTMAAMELARPDYDWEEHCNSFVSTFPPGSLARDPVTTQIGGRDSIAARLHLLVRLNGLLTGLCQDLWQYCSLGYFRIQRAEGQVGSSTMPQKVNPIPFEMAEGNFGLSSAMLTHIADKISRSRLQRDLSDSTVMRSLGSALAYSQVALASLSRGVAKLDFMFTPADAEAELHYEIMSEAAQTAMRVHGEAEAYEKVRAACQGLRGTSKSEFWAALKPVMPKAVFDRLSKLNMYDYLGSAARGWGAGPRSFEENGGKHE
jgi:adenylosuccinate lyase